MTDRRLPVRPNLEQLKHQAKDLLRALRRGESEARAEFERNHPRAPNSSDAKLADAQLALARAYGIASWPRLVLACRMTDAIWRDDVEVVRELVAAHPELLFESARGNDSNWGPPMSYAANLGRDRIIAMLAERGAKDVQHAFDRACLQGRLETARRLFAMGARPRAETLSWTCETLNDAGLAFLVELGVELATAARSENGPLATLLQTYSRRPSGKHRCLEIMAENGLELPDSAPMALHRGRRDRLEAHLERDRELFTRTFAHREIYPRELGCSPDESLALHGTPLDGATLLHMAIDFDEFELATWMLERGADPNARAAVDADGFGGHTALFATVVSQPFRVGACVDDRSARLLLDRGADPNVRASLRKRLRFVADETMQEYRDVAPISWGRRFHDRDWVSEPALALIAERGGRE